MRGFALFLLCISSLCIGGSAGALMWFFASLPVVEAVLAGAILFLLIMVVALVLQVRHLQAAFTDFADAAQDHIDLAQTHHADFAQMLEGIAARQTALRRDFVDHVASHTADDKITPDPQSAAATLLPAPSNSKQSIASAIMANRIDLFVQPTVILPNRKTVFYECLSRLRSESGATLYPSSFLEHAQKTKLIGTLDNFLLLRCVQIIRRLHRKAALETFFLNISAASLSDPDFYDQLVDFLASDHSLADHLVLELKANTLDGLLPRIAEGLGRLVEAGYRFALDGAEPKHVSGHLADHGFAYIKVPARTILSDAQPEALLHRMSASGLTIIATNIEDDKTLIEISELGVEYAQGYLIAKPTPWDAIDRQKQLSGAA